VIENRGKPKNGISYLQKRTELISLAIDWIFCAWCDIHAHALDAANKDVLSAFNLKEQAHFLQALEMQGIEESAYGQSLTAMLLCFEDDYRNITGALRLRIKSQQSRWALAPIFVEMIQDLQALSVSVDETPYFGQVEQICTWQEMVEGSSDDLAQFLHNAYNARYGNNQGTPWSQLSETFRDANRGAADHLGVKLASVGYWVSGDPSNWSRNVDLTVDPDAKELMAILEHRRWCAERLLNGWQYGSIRDNGRKIHPCIVPFDQLPESEKEKDRSNINDLQDYFASDIPKDVMNTALLALRKQWLGKKTGAKVLPAVSIALVVNGDQPALKTRLFELISQLFKDYEDYHITLMTALLNPLDIEFAQLAQTGSDSLIIPRAYPYDLQRDEDGVDAELIKSQLELSKKADWLIDLVPAGEKVIALSLKERALLRIRAVIYQLERADVVIFVGENAQWLKWRQGKETVPVALSSLPPSLHGTRKEQMPHDGWLVNDENVQPIS
jgi:hypothetical protein